MKFLLLVMLTVAIAPTADGADVELTTLDGVSHRGRISSLTETAIALNGDKLVEYKLANVLTVKVQSKSSKSDEQALSRVNLVDGSSFSCSNVQTQSGKLIAESKRFGPISIPTSFVASIRTGGADSKLEPTWKQLRSRDIKKDMLVIRKRSGVLDHTSGTIGNIGNDSLIFLLDSDEVPIKRDRVYGVVFYRRPRDVDTPLCRIETTANDSVLVRSVKLDGNRVRATLASGANVSIALAEIKLLDFSLGKILYLSDVKPRKVEITRSLAWDVGENYLNNRTSSNQPLRLAGKAYSRGLWIHSKTRLTYRLSGEYRRFRAIMGIDWGAAQRKTGDGVHVVITGDKKTLLETDVKPTDAPRPVELDLTDVIELKILVDFIKYDDRLKFDFGEGDQLDLVEARVIK